MIDPAAVSALVRAFSDPSDGAALKSRELILLLLECSPAPFSRHQFSPGHITCSGLVVSPGRERLLLVHHRRLDRWLLPGGHVEPEDPDIRAAGRREVIEETGAILAPDPPEPTLPAGRPRHPGPPSATIPPPHTTCSSHSKLRRFRVSEERAGLPPNSNDDSGKHAAPGPASGARVRKSCAVDPYVPATNCLQPMKTFTIAVIAGDGVGTEVIPRQARLETAAKKHDVTFAFQDFDWGAEHYLPLGPA